MEHLENLADKYGAAASVDESPRSQPQSAPEPEQSGGGENVARLVVTGAEFGFKMVDRRVNYQDAVYDEGAESLGPLFDKYGIGIGGGDEGGKMPYEEEIQGGLFVGRLWRRTWEGIRELWEQDEKEQKKNGKEREHETRQQPHAVSGQERVRQEPNPNPSQWDSAHG